MKGVVIAGTRSGVGKTVATLAVIKGLAAEGWSVQPAKAGPDFIDPSHHEQVAGRPSRTLDCWLQGAAGLRRNYARGSGDICVVEGVMGLYDGDGSSTAMVAETLDLPVILVVDASAGMESVAATVHGFSEYAAHAGRSIDVVGMIAQRAHGGRHESGIVSALPEEITYCGRIPPTDALEIPDRHLGLERGSESPLESDALAGAGESLDFEAIVECAHEPTTPTVDAPPSSASNTVAVASDDAFCFAYPATIERLRERASVKTVSVLDDDPLGPCDGIYLPGGYPELFADSLAESQTLSAIADRAVDGCPVLGECGGLLALADTLTTTDGTTHEMAGVLPANVRMHERYQALDHVELTATADTLTASAGQTVRGHEFHYSSATVDTDARFAFELARGTGIADGMDGLTEHRTLGTYCHCHPESGAFDQFLNGL